MWPVRHRPTHRFARQGNPPFITGRYGSLIHFVFGVFARAP